MPVPTYQQWKAAGSPWRPAPVIDRFAALMRQHGFVVYTLGDESHLQAHIPEDHTPYSHTPWPDNQPYPLVLALDVMPGGACDWRRLGEQIVADRRAGIPGTGWIKYINWTNSAGSCWHTSWEPSEVTRTSTDTGHLHLSARTDRIGDQLEGWDPVARILGMPSLSSALAMKGNDNMLFGDIPAGFGIDENDDWLNELSPRVPVPLPAVGKGPGRWGPAWLYLAGAAPAVIRYGCLGQYPTPVWAEAHLSLTRPAGPLPLPEGTTLLLLARKRSSDIDDTAPVRWQVQYGQDLA